MKVFFIFILLFNKQIGRLTFDVRETLLTIFVVLSKLLLSLIQTNQEENDDFSLLLFDVYCCDEAYLFVFYFL